MAQPPSASPDDETTGQRRLAVIEDVEQVQGKPYTGEGRFRVLMLISDTGGGHRASAAALVGALELRYPGLCDVRVLDIWTDYGVWPFTTLVPAYQYLCANPRYWRLLYDYTQARVSRGMINTGGYVLCGNRFKEAFREYQPHLVVSVHPLCQHVPLRIMASLPKPSPPAIARTAANHPPPPPLPAPTCRLAGSATTRRREGGPPHQAAALTAPSLGSALQRAFPKSLFEPATSTRENRSIPFVTVVTDLGHVHPTWFCPDVDLCFVPSTTIAAAARREGLVESQIRLHGLPIRSDFWVRDKRSKQSVRRTLGLEEDGRVVLLIGGGEGMGSMVDLVFELEKQLRCLSEPTQVVVICGKNSALLREVKTRFHRYVPRHRRDHTSSTTAADPTETRSTVGPLHEKSTRMNLERRQTWPDTKMERDVLLRLSKAKFPRSRTSPNVSRLASKSEARSLNFEAQETCASTAEAAPPISAQPTDAQQPSVLGWLSTQWLSGTSAVAGYDSSRDATPQFSWDQLTSFFWAAPHESGDEKCPNSKEVDHQASAMATSPSVLTSFGTGRVSIVPMGFCTNIADYMSAADLLITKAGPGTIAEACARALPMVLFSFLPGQEEGNVHFVLRQRIGLYKPDFDRLAVTVRNMLATPASLTAFSNRALRAMDPLSACRIVDDMVHLMLSRVCPAGE